MGALSVSGAVSQLRNTFCLHFVFIFLKVTSSHQRACLAASSQQEFSFLARRFYELVATTDTENELFDDCTEKLQND